MSVIMSHSRLGSIRLVNILAMSCVGLGGMSVYQCPWGLTPECFLYRLMLDAFTEADAHIANESWEEIFSLPFCKSTNSKHEKVPKTG